MVSYFRIKVGMIFPAFLSVGALCMGWRLGLHIFANRGNTLPSQPGISSLTSDKETTVFLDTRLYILRTVGVSLSASEDSIAGDA